MRTDLIITGGAVANQVSREVSHCVTPVLRRRSKVSPQQFSPSESLTDGVLIAGSPTA